MGMYVLIGRNEKTPMLLHLMNHNAFYEPVPRQAEVPNLTSYGDTPSFPGTPAHVLHEAHQRMSTVSN